MEATRRTWQSLDMNLGCIGFLFQLLLPSRLLITTNSWQTLSWQGSLREHGSWPSNETWGYCVQGLLPDLSLKVRIRMLNRTTMIQSNFATVEPATMVVTSRRADRHFEEYGPPFCAELDGLELPSFPGYEVSVKYATEHRHDPTLKPSLYNLSDH